MLKTTALAATLILDFGDSSQVATMSSDPEGGWTGGSRRGGVSCCGGTDFPTRDVRPSCVSIGRWRVDALCNFLPLGTGPCGRSALDAWAPAGSPPPALGPLPPVTGTLAASSSAKSLV